MRKLFIKLFLIITIGLFSACSSLKAPEYIGIENVKVNSLKNDTVYIDADVFFKNPNLISGKIFTHEIRAYVNQIDMGFLENQTVKVPAKKEFSIPLKLNIPYDKIFDNKKGLLSTLWNSIVNNKIDVTLDGEVGFKSFLIKKEYPVHYSKSLKLIKE